MRDSLMWLAIFFFALSFFLAISIIAHSAWNRKNFGKIIELYEERFGRLPALLAFFKKSEFLGSQYTGGYQYKINYFLMPLLLKKDSHIIKAMKISGDVYDFIRSLPHELTRWIIIEQVLAFLALLCVIVSAILMKIAGVI